MKSDKLGFGPLPMMRFLGKGDFKLLVLRVLRDKPMHGYEIMGVVEQRSHGLYRPSPGAIYPTLASLERRGFVKGRTLEGRKAYTLTKAGKAYIRSREEEVEARIAEMEQSIGPEKTALMRELRALGRRVFAGFWDWSPGEAARVKAIIQRFRRELEEAVLK